MSAAVSADERKRLEQIAQRRKWTLSFVVREAVVEYLEREAA